jgi:hypothetical protein
MCVRCWKRPDIAPNYWCWSQSLYFHLLVHVHVLSSFVGTPRDFERVSVLHPADWSSYLHALHTCILLVHEFNPLASLNAVAGGGGTLGGALLRRVGPYPTAHKPHTGVCVCVYTCWNEAFATQRTAYGSGFIFCTAHTVVHTLIH